MNLEAILYTNNKTNNRYILEDFKCKGVILLDKVIYLISQNLYLNQFKNI